MIQFLAPLLRLAEDEVAKESSGIDLLLPETSELIAGFIAFSIIFVFVWKWVLPAANKVLAARQEAITGQLQEAEAAKQEAGSLLEDYKKQLSQCALRQALCCAPRQSVLRAGRQLLADQTPFRLRPRS